MSLLKNIKLFYFQLFQVFFFIIDQKKAIYNDAINDGGLKTNANACPIISQFIQQ